MKKCVPVSQKLQKV